MATKKEVVEQPKAGLPEGYDMEELQQDAAQNETMGTGDIALPYYYILQSNSPQVNPGLPAYVEGAQASMFFNNVTGEVFEGRETGLVVIPCAYERKLVEWTPRDEGGGWVNDYDINDPIQRTAKPNEKKKLQLPNGNLLVETAYQYSLTLNPHEGSWGQSVWPLSSSMLKMNRKWNNDIVTSKIPGTDMQAPRFLFPYQIKTEITTRNGNSWWIPVIDKIDEVVAPDLYKMAKEFAHLVREGLVTRGAESSAGGTIEGSDIPF